MSTHNVYPFKPQFCYLKVGCKGVYITRTCLHDTLQVLVSWISSYICKYTALQYHMLLIFYSVFF